MYRAKIHFPPQAPLMDPGEAGQEDLMPGGDSVTVHLRPTVVQTVRWRALRRESVTITPESQVNIGLKSKFYSSQT